MNGHRETEPLELLSAYLHQDWEVFYPNLRVALLSLFHDEPQPITAPLIDEATRLVASSASDEDIEVRVRRYVDYAYDRDGLTARQFLEEVIKVAESIKE